MDHWEGSVDAFVAARAERPGWPGVAPWLRPLSIADGYRLQQAVHAETAARGDRRLGWKVASTTAAGQKTFGITEPARAGLFDSGHAATLAEALARPYAAPSLECEIALVLKAPIIGGDLSDAALADAVGSCHISCEVIDNRYGQPLEAGVPSLIADDFFQAGFVIGAANPAWREQALAEADAAIEIDGKTYAGSARTVLSAFDSLRWLAGKLIEAAQPLQAGEVVMTGAIVGPIAITLPARSVNLSISGFAPLTLAA